MAATAARPGASGMSERHPPSPSSRLRPVGFARLAACLLAAALFLLPGAKTAQAQTKLVSNVDTERKVIGNTLADDAWGQAFTTGSRAGGYKLTRVQLGLFRQNARMAPSYGVSIRTSSAGNPGASLGTLTKPASLPTSYELLRFTAPGSGIDLAADTTYFVVVEVDAGSDPLNVVVTTSDVEDPTPASGWSIADISRKRISNNWGNNSHSVLLALYEDLSGGSAPEAQKQVLKRTLAAVASRTVSSALDAIGARMGDAAPGSSLTLGGQSVWLGGSGTVAAPGYGAACLPDGFGRHGFARGFGADRGVCAPGPRSRSFAADRLSRASAFSLTLGAAPSGPAGRDTQRRDAGDAAPAPRNETIARTWTTAQSRTADGTAARNETIAQGRTEDEPAGPGRIDPETEAMLDGRGSSDPEGDELKFSWTQVSGAKVTLRDAGTATPSFTAPAAPGPLTFRLTVTDRGGLSASAEVTLRVRDLVPGFGGAAPEPLALTVGRGIDPVVLPAARGGNGTLRYSLTSSPAGLAGLEFDPATRRLSGTATAAGSYAFTLRAVDVDGDAAELALRVETLQNQAPVARIGKLNRAPVARVEPPAPAGDARKTEVPPPAADRGGERAAADTGRPLWSVWGRGDLGAFAGRPEAGMRYEGSTRTGWLGVDARGIRGSGRWVAGLAVSHGISESDYSFEGGADPSERGKLETALTSLWPYGRWTFADGLELRGMLGAGTGTLRHKPGGGEPAEKSKLTMWAGSVGVRQNLPPVARIDLAARGDASFARILSEGGGETLDGLRADSWRLRAGLEASRRFALPGSGSGTGKDEASLTPFLELAARQDGGDGVTGTGLEVAGGLRYAAPGVAVELRGRWLAAHTQGGTEERGVSLTARMLPGDRGRGLSLSLTPRWGAGAGGADALWREELPKGAGAGGRADAPGRLEGEIGYGMAMFGDRFTGTPNAGFGFSDAARDWRIGWRLTSAVRGDPGFQVDLDATRRETDGDDPAEHGVFLHSTIRW